ncbi:MAG: tetratricopeptide repeat protein, partial [Candidatus Aureabacteria bacterium]|nr:tetratricopeptide repeat protein [Candidatus Auribacterota bacterium]
DPLYLTARLCLGDAYLREQRYDEALAQYSCIEGTWPRRGNGQLKIALVYRARGERQKTIAKLNEFLAIHPGDTLGTITLAGVLADSGDSAGAERLFRDALRNNPSSAIPLNNYGLFLEGRGRTAEAIAIFSRASEVSPREAAPHFNLARIHEREGRPGEALIAMMRAAERKPGEARYLEEINRISGRVGEVDIPAPLVAAIDAGHRALLAARGIYCSRIGDGGGAEECFKKLVALRPSDGAARANLGRIYADRGEYTMALRELLRAADLLPGEASVHTSLGFCYEKLGRRTDALREWERARALDPMAKEPRRNIARIRGGG